MYNFPEIKIKYIKGNFPQIKIVGFEEAFEVVKGLFDMDTINFQERAIVIYTNNNNITIGWHLLSFGGTTSVIVDRSVVLSLALKIGAKGIVLAHNHPSGNYIPSKADIDITRTMVQACNLFNMRLLDHIIVFENEKGEISFTSLSKMGYCS